MIVNRLCCSFATYSLWLTTYGVAS